MRLEHNHTRNQAAELTLSDTFGCPVTQTADEKSAFRSFIYLFSRLYPCGECAAHFQLLLKDFPPQVSLQ